ncbi:MAG: hypothetical protein R3D27_01015 [Hyphomicrobiaceae bacterium]
MAHVMIRSGDVRTRRLALVSLLAAFAAAKALAIQPAVAADLSGRYDPYEDPRYADIYRDPPPRHIPPPPPRRYAEPPRYVEPPPSYKDDVPRDRYGRLLPFNGERRYAGRHPSDEFYGGRGDRCVPRDLVRERLARDGWHDFHAAELDGPFALVNARNESGRLYVLRIDRCSGEIVEARLLDGPRGRPFAWRTPGHERYRF